MRINVSRQTKSLANSQRWINGCCHLANTIIVAYTSFGSMKREEAGLRRRGALMTSAAMVADRVVAITTGTRERLVSRQQERPNRRRGLLSFAHVNETFNYVCNMPGINPVPYKLGQEWRLVSTFIHFYPSPANRFSRWHIIVCRVSLMTRRTAGNLREKWGFYSTMKSCLELPNGISCEVIFRIVSESRSVLV